MVFIHSKVKLIECIRVLSSIYVEFVNLFHSDFTKQSIYLNQILPTTYFTIYHNEMNIFNGTHLHFIKNEKICL